MKGIEYNTGAGKYMVGFTDGGEIDLTPMDGADERAMPFLKELFKRYFSKGKDYLSREILRQIEGMGEYSIYPLPYIEYPPEGASM